MSTDRSAAIAKAIADAAQSQGVKGRPTVVQARAIVEAWLKSQGLRADRWGNYVFQNGERRFNFGKTALRRQGKVGGSWSTLSSSGVIDYAVSLLGQAVGELPEIERQQLADTVGRAKASAQSSADRRKLELVRAEAEILAFKRTEAEYRDDVYRNMIAGKKLSDARAAEINEALKRYKQEMVGLLQTEGFQKPGDGSFVDVDRPPLLPILSAGGKYFWVDQADGIAYSIRVAHEGKGVARVEIGSAGTVAVDPRTMRMIHAPSGAVGDSYISGYVQRVEGTLIGVLFLIISQTKLSGAGSRAFSLWLRMMKGYGIDLWVAEAVGAEGEAFLQAMARRGLIQLGRRFGSANIEVSSL